jgi:hypothetical protein
MSVVGYQASLIQFGDYVFPAAFYVSERDQENDLDDQKIPLRDGSVIPIGSRKAKTISIAGTIGGHGAVDSSGNYILNRDQATAELNLMELALSQGKQPLIVGDSDARVIICQRKMMKAKPLQGGRAMTIDVQIDFVAEDPRWQSATLRSGGPFAPGSETITAVGNAIAYPIITITATANNVPCPAVSISPAGFGGVVQVTPTLTLASGDVVAIDSNPRNRPNAIMYNGVARLDTLSTASAIFNSIGNAEFFPYLLGGENAVDVNNASSSGFTWTIVWNDAYLY